MNRPERGLPPAAKQKRNRFSGHAKQLSARQTGLPDTQNWSKILLSRRRPCPW